MPLGSVLVRARRRTAILAPETVDGQGEQARLLERMLDADRVQLYAAKVSGRC